MKQEDYKKEISILDVQIIAAKTRKEAIRAEFLRANAEFGLGDIVDVITEERPHPFDKTKKMPEKRVRVWVRRIHDSGYTGIVNYDFGKVKKDGTKGIHTEHTYRYDRIELIQKANPENNH